MDIVIIGSGAMVGLFGGLLAESGQVVRLIDVPGPHLSALIQHGLRLQTDSGDRTIGVRAGPADSFAGPCDLAIVFTKGPHTEAAVCAASHLIGPATWVLTVQNGLGNEAAIRAAVPHARVATGMTSWPADLAGPGHVVSHGHGTVRIWSSEPQPDAAMHQIAAVLTTAGLDCTADPQVEVAVWEKVAFNAGMNSVAAVTRLPVGPIADHPAGRALVSAIVTETLAVATARGLAVDADRVWRTLEMAFADHRSHQPSMLQDVLAGRQTEIENINGAIVAYATELGIDTPVTKSMRDLVRLIAHAHANAAKLG
ncbi:ketopantoate reductase family protein [Acidisphaera sp. S103]|uniref:ketopantoate reductase family protein n=1 Tax=Acidisphaera sp. S103 TaxID=1747223 RepID=UPI00131E1A32|nr:ketopantoate reductase family protein [Acidisphaera sp. S103]